jgi:drug/metabolite transporter (DMT)-like permease
MKSAVSRVFALALLSVIWGSSFILMKRALFTTDAIPTPLLNGGQLGSLRMFLASIVLLPVAISYLRKLEVKPKIISFGVVAMFGNFIPAFIFAYAGAHMPSFLSGMLNSFTPIFTLIVGLVIFKQKTKASQILGLLLAVVGVTLLLYFKVQHPNTKESSWIFPALVILATLMYGISVNTIKYNLQQFPSLAITSIAFSISFIPATIACFYTGVFQTIMTIPHGYEALGYAAILAIVGTAFSVWLFNRIIAYSSALFASSVTYFMPIVAILLGTIDGELILPIQLLAMGIIIVGVLIANDILLKRRS